MKTALGMLVAAACMLALTCDDAGHRDFTSDNDPAAVVHDAHPPAAMPTSGDPVVVAAGDIASCSSTGDSATSALLGSLSYTSIITLGDNAYEAGTATEYANCYDPTWGGAYKPLTRPAPGNHEYVTAGASG
jgi:hypothetical protein